MMSVILFQPVAISTEKSTDRPCARDMCSAAKSFTHESNTCVIRRLAFLNLGSIDKLSCNAPRHPPQPCIKEFWFVHEPQNLEIASREVGNFQMIVLPFGVWVIGVAQKRVRKID